MVHHLLLRELGDGRKHPKGVAGQEDHVAGVAVNLGRDECVGDVVQRVCTPRVLRQGDVVVVDLSAPLVEDHILQHAPEADGVVNLRLLLTRQVDALGIAAALDVEDTLGRPDVLIVSDELPCRVGAEGRLPSATEPEEEGDILGS